MVDYSEGYLNLKRMVQELWDALNEQRLTDAQEICSKIVGEARLTRAQICIQDGDAK